jgi:pyruvate carboxylase subunit A
MFEKIVVANRGEIALRVMRTCAEMGVATVAIYSDADKHALHTKYAAESFNVGPGPSLQSYLNSDRIIDIAKETGAEAIHPGYGFLAENSKFARKCAENNIVFIGPDATAMENSGDKISSRKLVKKQGIQVTPGSDEAVDENNALEIANEIGYPVILKSSGGGGGISMGVVEDKDELLKKLETARTSSISAFGDSNIFIEKYLYKPRHIEFQILADTHGNIIHLGERECSIQRRFQKLIEEAPSVVVNDSIREEIGERAVEIARAANYSNAGTIEFLYTGNEFYFNEVNARLQVEHPITEMITSTDLVKQQLRIAAGEELEHVQKDITYKGWATECRINAEDPYNNFLPSAGTLNYYEPPGSIGVRIDSGVVAGSQIPTFYDPLFAKIITWSGTRERSVERMIRALKETTIRGIMTNIPFHIAVLETSAYREGDIDTLFLKRNRIIETMREEGKRKMDDMTVKAAAIAAALSHLKGGIKKYVPDGANRDLPCPRSSWRARGRNEHVSRGLKR